MGDESRNGSARSEQISSTHERLLNHRIALAEHYHCTGQFDYAIAQYDECLRHSPSLDLIRRKMAAVLMLQHKYQQAEAILLAMIEGGVNEPALISMLGMAVFLRRRWGGPAFLEIT